jgi:hypothetical protein
MYSPVAGNIETISLEMGIWMNLLSVEWTSKYDWTITFFMLVTLRRFFCFYRTIWEIGGQMCWDRCLAESLMVDNYQYQCKLVDSDNITQEDQRKDVKTTDNVR